MQIYSGTVVSDPRVAPTRAFKSTNMSSSPVRSRSAEMLSHIPVCAYKSAVTLAISLVPLLTVQRRARGVECAYQQAAAA